jgi:CubicO group peptidase (beta-lactamase class C family)
MFTPSGRLLSTEINFEKAKKQIMKKSLLRGFVAIIVTGSLQACEYHDQPATDAKVLEAQVAGLVKDCSAKLPFEAPVAWAMVRKGEVVASYRQGAEIPGGSTMVSEHSRFILASAAKLFTSVMVMKAVEEGKIQLTAKITDYIVSLPLAWQEITISQLLSHTDGIADVVGNSRYRALPQATAEVMSRPEYVTYAADLPLHFVPGSETRYGQTGFVLLSMVLESVYGLLYEQIITTRILAPLKMMETQFITGSSAFGEYKPQIFEPEGKGFKKVTPPYVYADYATAGMCSSLGDMIRFVKALQAGMIVSEQGFRRIFTPLKGGKEFALGWQFRYKNGRLMAGHSGGWSVVVMHFPDSASTSIFLSGAAVESMLDAGYKVAEKALEYSLKEVDK